MAHHGTGMRLGGKDSRHTDTTCSPGHSTVTSIPADATSAHQNITGQALGSSSVHRDILRANIDPVFIVITNLCREHMRGWTTKMLYANELFHNQALAFTISRLCASSTFPPVLVRQNILQLICSTRFRAVLPRPSLSNRTGSRTIRCHAYRSAGLDKCFLHFLDMLQSLELANGCLDLHSRAGPQVISPLPPPNFKCQLPFAFHCIEPPAPRRFDHKLRRARHRTRSSRRTTPGTRHQLGPRSGRSKGRALPARPETAVAARDR